MVKKSIGSRSALIVLVVGATALGQASLTSVGVLDETSPHSMIRAVSPDGQWAVGESNAVIIIDQQGNTDMRTTTCLWSEATGLLNIDNPSGANSYCNGVDIRPGMGTEGVDQILLGGMVGGISRTWKADVTDPAGGEWSVIPGVEYAPQQFLSGSYNQIRVDSDPEYQYGDGRWYMPYTTASNQNRFGRWRGDPNVEWDTPNGIVGPVHLGGVSATGVVVGTNRNRLRTAMYSDIPDGFLVIPGGGGLRSEGLGISTDGAWMCGIDYVDTENLIYQAFVWETGTAGMTLRGQWGHCDTRSAAYAVNNNGTAVGFSWNSSNDGEMAVVWDTTGTWDSSGQARRIADLLSANGVDISAWRELTRALTISDDGKVIAGYGTWDADGSVRGFVAKLTEPLSPVPLPVLGACCVNEGPDAGTCSITTAAECASTPYGVYLENACCDACPGACCNPDATCSTEFADDCAANEGIFQGPLSLCTEEGMCTGACCMGFQVCQETMYGACDGDFAGIGVDCETAECPCSISTRVWADADVDGAVDMSDFAALQRCLTLGYPSAGVDENCLCFDRNQDDVLDAVDVEEFLKCGTGSGVQWIDVLPPDCTP